MSSQAARIVMTTPANVSTSAIADLRSSSRKVTPVNPGPKPKKVITVANPTFGVETRKTLSVDQDQVALQSSAVAMPENVMKAVDFTKKHKSKFKIAGLLILGAFTGVALFGGK